MGRRGRQQQRRRTLVELEAGAIALYTPDGRSRTIALSGAAYSVCDAACAQRFVRLIRVDGPDGAAVMTPPELGAIAPRALRLPVAPDDAVVIEAGVFDAVLDWLHTRGRLGGRTIDDLARLARVASASLAVAIGEAAGQVARELAWGGSGPMRGSGLDGPRLLRPLELAARDSERAGDAWVAALAWWPVGAPV